MDLSTTYVGFDLPHPLMVGASPMARDLDLVRRLEDAGASAIVMHSLFEEQLVAEELATATAIDDPAHAYAEATGYFPSHPEFALGPDEYLQHLSRVKQAVSIPVFGSLNGVSSGGWLRYAHLMEQAGADALELNVYDLATDLDQNADAIERQTLDLVRDVRERVNIPLAIKLSPFYTALPHFARQLMEVGADGLVLFNRFYQPDIDVEELEVIRLNLSDSSDLLLRLHWLAILHERVDASLAVTGGVHNAIDAIKAVMTGAAAVQMVSALLEHGPDHLRSVRRDMITWLEEHEYESLGQMYGSMNLLRCPSPHAYERANYMQVLASWRPMDGGIA